MLFPTVIIAISALIYLSFYMHDRVKIQSILDHGAARINFLLKHEGDLNAERIYYENLGDREIKYLVIRDSGSLKTEIKRNLLRAFEKNLFLLDIITLDIDIDAVYANLEVYYKYRISMPDVGRYFIKSKVSGKYIKSKTIIHNPSEFVRRYDALSSLIKRGEQHW